MKAKPVVEDHVGPLPGDALLVLFSFARQLVGPLLHSLSQQGHVVGRSCRRRTGFSVLSMLWT